MGVPLLLTWLKRRFASCFLPSNSSPDTDCLYIDVNGLVYQAAALVTSGEGSTEGDIGTAITYRLFDLLDDIILRLVQPRSLVYLAVDGISPMGKLAQQRSRRRRRRHDNNFPSNHNRNVEWDSNSITVGTPFMSTLTYALHFYCSSRAERINVERLRQYRSTAGGNAPGDTVPVPVTFVVDDVWRPGEGESKIADAIRRFRSQPSYNPNTSHVICSSDTDMTVCSLILHEPRMHVLRYVYAAENVSHCDGSGSRHNHTGDSWASTFFSIFAFREELRIKLRLPPCNDDAEMSAEELEQRHQRFERALHDVVFVLQLFGNDFLPSLGCRIEEGFLDNLLDMLATDFITRGRSIVDPDTNTIQFDGARYALETLAEMRNERVGGLHVENGAEGALDWGFVDEKFKEQQAAEEAKQAPRCYAYWTMLQWSLQNSAGVVEHWGCYYPYNSAPPLHLLRKYCGTLSYEALMQLAESRTRKSDTTPRDDDSKGEFLRDESVVVGMRGTQPTDVLAQLLVLLPARSVALLPSAVRNAYAEIEPLVTAPIGSIDFSAINTWCASKRKLFTEEERTRFDSYTLAASNQVLAGKEGQGFICGNEMLFAAYWDKNSFLEEVQWHREMKLGIDEGVKDGECSTGEAASSCTATVGSGALTSSFFRARSTRKTTAAIAALRAASENSRPDEQGEAENTKPGAGQDASCGTVGIEEQEGRDCRLKPVDALVGEHFTLYTSTTSALGNAAMERRVGAIVGDIFTCGTFRTSPLSRHPKTMRLRLQWQLAARPPRNEFAFVPTLLHGFRSSPLVRKPGRAKKRSISEVDNVDSEHGDRNRECVSEQCSSDCTNQGGTPAVARDGKLLMEMKEMLQRRLKTLSEQDEK
ncbi:putative XRN 5' 3' exonuclease N terminus [Trypanosoma vivax]|uniref:Putative 5'-3' exonuclease XRNC n=1 Tax=Trypanosoma vivax (strain Y486) TaxID=1055687 RepID=G0U0M4_TRYVY|nr:putative 5'-3' exonuclease XRNC [Trypanosoma vivax]KAH8610938.1 putative XRN 5' 3' exonuclease N terminus [Trypanosoma vivax]CCC49623.1 putative 5'-3' exonuclease XRNC [Trypanosoma vivax Y486]